MLKKITDCQVEIQIIVFVATPIEPSNLPGFGDKINKYMESMNEVKIRLEAEHKFHLRKKVSVDGDLGFVGICIIYRMPL
jgi:hypothetical protein